MPEPTITILTISVIIGGVNCAFSIIPMLSIISVRFWKWWYSAWYSRMLVSYDQDPYRFYYTSLIIHKLLKETDDTGVSTGCLSLIEPVSGKKQTLDVVYPNTFLYIPCKTEHKTYYIYIYSNSQTYNEKITDYIIYYDAKNNDVKKCMQILYFAVGMNISKCFSTFKISDKTKLNELQIAYNQIMKNITDFKMNLRNKELNEYFKSNKITEVNEHNIQSIINSYNFKLRQPIYKSFIIKYYDLYMTNYLKNINNTPTVQGHPPQPETDFNIGDINNLTFDDYILLINLLKKTENQQILMNVISCNNLKHYCRYNIADFGDLYSFMANNLQCTQIIGDFIDNCKNHDLRDCLTILFIEYIKKMSILEIDSNFNFNGLIESVFDSSNKMLSIKMEQSTPVPITMIESSTVSCDSETTTLLNRNRSAE